LKAYEEWEALGPKGLEFLAGFVALYYLNRPQDAAAAAKALPRHVAEIPTANSTQPNTMLGYLAGTLGEEKLLAATPGSD
jgi:hypothetical protein